MFPKTAQFMVFSYILSTASERKSFLDSLDPISLVLFRSCLLSLILGFDKTYQLSQAAVLSPPKVNLTEIIVGVAKELSRNDLSFVPKETKRGLS